MEIQLYDVSKRFRFEWIFKGVNYQLANQERYVLLGPNGSGKSTLMKVIAGQLTPSKGSITYTHQQNRIAIESVYHYISFAAPYIELIEEFTLTEMIDFHQKFKPFHKTIDSDALITLLGFEKSRHKEIRFFSSGMKQRLKLALAICADTPLLLLDEPTTNLDAQGTTWYRSLLENYGQNRTVVIATNVEADYSFFCNKTINIFDYKN